MEAAFGIQHGSDSGFAVKELSILEVSLIAEEYTSSCSPEEVDIVEALDETLLETWVGATLVLVQRGNCNADRNPKSSQLSTPLSIPANALDESLESIIYEAKFS